VRWFDYNHATGGSTRVDARLTGPLSGPDVTVAATGREVAVAGVPPASIEAAAHIANGSAELTSLRVRLAGGSLSANGRTAFDGPGAIRAQWQGIDLAAVLREAMQTHFRASAFRHQGVRAARSTRWTAPRLEAVEPQLRCTPNMATAGGLPVDGSATLTARAGMAADGEGHRHHWRPRGRQRRGRVNADHLLHSTIEGSINVRTDDAGQLAASLAESGLVKTAAHISGSGTVDLAVSGKVDALSLDGLLRASILTNRCRPRCFGRTYPSRCPAPAPGDRDPAWRLVCAG
jgi:hypothetical protein